MRDAEKQETTEPNWSTILHVCRLWRYVASKTPALWTHFSPSLPAFVRTSIERAGSLPLTVLPAKEGKEAGDANVAKSFELILSHVAQLRGMEVTFTDGVRSVLGQKRWRALVAPMLEELAVRGCDEEQEFLPFSTMKLPKLRRLAASEGSFASLKATIRPTITELELDSYWRTDVADILHILTQLPSLKRLSLRDVCDCETIDPFELEQSSTEIVNLPRLEYLIMSSDAAWLLPYLSFPLETRILVATEGIPHPEEACIAADNIKEHVLVHMQAPSRSAASGVRYPTELEIRCSCPEYRSMEFDCCFRTPPVPFAPYPGSALRPEDRLHFILTINASMQSFEGLATLLFSEENTYGTITRVSIFTTYDEDEQALWDYTPWQAVFRALPNLHTLHLSFDAVRAFTTYAWLQEGMSRFDHYQNWPLLYPSLKVLRLTSAKFLKCVDGIQEHDLINQLVGGLKWMKGQGLRLERLEIETPINFPPVCRSMIEGTQIAKTVDVMDWGHHTEGQFSDEDADLGEEDDEDDDEDADEDEDEDDLEYEDELEDIDEDGGPNDRLD